jgi:Reversibly glycosylated polypeptide
MRLFLESSDILSSPSAHPVVTVPFGLMFSLSLANVAVNRAMVGPCLFVPSSLLDALPVGNKNLEVLAGWIGKKALDHVYVGVKHGGKTHVLIKDPETTIDSLSEPLF